MSGLHGYLTNVIFERKNVVGGAQGENNYSFYETQNLLLVFFAQYKRSVHSNMFFLKLYSPSNKHKDQYCIECKLLVVIQRQELLPLIEIGGERGCVLLGCEPDQWPASSTLYTVQL